MRVSGLGEVGGIVKRTGTAGGSLTIGIEGQEGAAQGSKVSGEGRFAFTRVLPGYYTFRLLKNPSHAVLGTVRCGGAPVTEDSPLQMTDKQKIADCELIVESAQH